MKWSYADYIYILQRGQLTDDEVDLAKLAMKRYPDLRDGKEPALLRSVQRMIARHVRITKEEAATTQPDPVSDETLMAVF